MNMDQIVVLFDGYCVLCSGFAKWLRRKLGGFAKLIAMQSEQGQSILERYGFQNSEVSEVVVMANGEVITGSSAILFILKMAGKSGRFLYGALRIFPSAWIRWGYRVVAQNRYRWFGKRATCTIIQD